MGLGDAVERALSQAGITDERVSRWLGQPCGCKERRDKLNRLSDWARSLITGASDNTLAAEQLDNLMKTGLDVVPVKAKPVGITSSAPKSRSVRPTARRQSIAKVGPIAVRDHHTNQQGNMMTEAQYIRTANIVKLRIAHNVLGDVLFLSGDQREEKRRAILEGIYKLIQTIEVEQHADPITQG